MLNYIQCFVENVMHAYLQSGRTRFARSKFATVNEVMCTSVLYQVIILS